MSSLSDRRLAPARNTLLLGVFAWLCFTVVASLSFFDRELWSDEAITLLFASGHDPAQIVPGIYDPADIRTFYSTSGVSPLEVWRLAAAGDNHPPGYPAFLSALLSAAGANELDPGWLRTVNIALAALFVFPALALARRLGAGAHWLPLATIVFSPFAFYLTRELRAYGMMLPLVLAAALLCLRLKDARIRPIVFLATLLAINLAGCLLHKLFLGVVAAEVACLAALAVADGARRREFATLAAGTAVATLVLTAPIPNLFSTTATTGVFEIAWLEAPRTLVPFAEALLRYTAYFLSWWITPPDNPFATMAGIVFVVAFLPLLLILLTCAVREAAWLRPDAPTLLFIAVPLCFLFSIHVVMGIDLSKTPRFSVVWAPVAAIWLTARMERFPISRWLRSWTALATATSSALVLAGYAHTSPDGARRFAATLPKAAVESLVWLQDGSLNGKGLLIALSSEMDRADLAPASYEIVPLADWPPPLPSAGAPPRIIAASRRQAAEIRAICAAGKVVAKREYVACVLQ